MKMRMAPPYRTRQIARKGKASVCPGSKKGSNCQTDVQKKFFACNVKARYHPQYAQWNDKFREMNHGSKGK